MHLLIVIHEVLDFDRSLPLCISVKFYDFGSSWGKPWGEVSGMDTAEQVEEMVVRGRSNKTETISSSRPHFIEEPTSQEFCGSVCRMDTTTSVTPLAPWPKLCLSDVSGIGEVVGCILTASFLTSRGTLKRPSLSSSAILLGSIKCNRKRDDDILSRGFGPVWCFKWVRHRCDHRLPYRQGGIDV